MRSRTNKQSEILFYFMLYRACAVNFKTSPMATTEFARTYPAPGPIGSTRKRNESVLPLYIELVTVHEVSQERLSHALDSTSRRERRARARGRRRAQRSNPPKIHQLSVCTPSATTDGGKHRRTHVNRQHRPKVTSGQQVVVRA
jgi:hypothetical protein